MTEQIHPHRVLIAGKLHTEFAELLAAVRPDLELRALPLEHVGIQDLEWADTYLGFRRPALPTMGRVQWVHCTGAGVDAWLYPVALPADILLTRSSESFGPMIAEWALARALTFTQEILPLAEEQRAHEWRARDPRFIRGTKAVVVGTGDVGTNVARAFAALGCTMIGVSRTGRGDPSVFSDVHPAASLRAVVGKADWLILVLPLTAATHHLVGREILSACRGAILINAGRGAVVDESLIPEALERGWLRGAALDVFEIEPLPASSPLWDNPRVMISPHNSGPTTIDAAIRGFTETLDEIERGVRPTWIVDRARQY